MWWAVDVVDGVVGDDATDWESVLDDVVDEQIFADCCLVGKSAKRGINGKVSYAE